MDNNTYTFPDIMKMATSHFPHLNYLLSWDKDTYFFRRIKYDENNKPIFKLIWHMWDKDSITYYEYIPQKDWEMMCSPERLWSDLFSSFGVQKG